MFICHVCNSTKSHVEFINEIFEIDGNFYLVENIPAEACLRCKEKTFSGETGESIRIMLCSESKPIKSLVLNVFSYQQEVKAS